MRQLLVLGTIAVLLSCGLIMASCDDGACCSANDFKAAQRGEIKVEDMGKCCIEVRAAVNLYIDAVKKGESFSEAEFKKTYDCCYDAANGAGVFDN